MVYPVSSVTDTCVTIFDSYKVPKQDFVPCLNDLRMHYDVTVLRERSNRSFEDEWACHNFLYNIDVFKLFRSHTKDVDMQYPLSWWEKMVYPCFGWFSKIFIK